MCLAKILDKMCNLHSILILSFVVSLIFIYKWLNSDNQTKKQPPSPPKLPILGNLHQLGKSPHRTLQSMSVKYGELMLLHLGSKPTLVVSSANAAKEIMKTHDIIFANRPKSNIVNKLLYDGKDVAFSNYGEYWRQMKSLCVLRLLSNTKVRSFRAIREEELALMIEKIKKTKLLVVNLSEIIMKFTNDVICRAAFGRKYSGEGGNNFEELVKTFQYVLGAFSEGDFIPWLSWVDKVTGLVGKVDKVGKEFDAFLERVVQEHVNAYSAEKMEENKDFVDVLLEAQMAKTTGFSIGRESIKALILDMFAAGKDTTYTVIEWAMSELLRHPGVLKQLQKEVRSITQGKERINEDDLAKMNYLKAVIKETLRLHPPDPLLIFRESSKAVKLNGYDIASRTQVIINAWAIHRDPSSWTDPEKFYPERFLSCSLDFRGQNFKFIPFGAGRRSCPGISFATISMELVLANLVNAFDWTLPVDIDPKSLDMNERQGIIIHRREHLLAVATPLHCT